MGTCGIEHSGWTALPVPCGAIELVLEHAVSAERASARIIAANADFLDMVYSS
jgi:hypothetical protein